MKHFLLSFALIIFLATSALAVDGNAILFSWDGAEREHVKQLAVAGKMPVIDGFMKTGSFVEIKLTGHVTATGPSHANMLTGYGPDGNFVLSNAAFLPIPEGLTVGERLEQNLGAENIVTVMVMGKAGYMGAQSLQPYNNAKKIIDVWDGDKGRRDAPAVAELGLKYIEQFKEKRFFIFLHFIDPDTKGHGFGENTPEYEQALMDCDALSGKIIDKLKIKNILNEINTEK